MIHMGTDYVPIPINTRAGKEIFGTQWTHDTSLSTQNLTLHSASTVNILPETLCSCLVYHFYYLILNRHIASLFTLVASDLLSTKKSIITPNPLSLIRGLPDLISLLIGLILHPVSDARRGGDASCSPVSWKGHTLAMYLVCEQFKHQHASLLAWHSCVMTVAFMEATKLWGLLTYGNDVRVRASYGRIPRG